MFINSEHILFHMIDKEVKLRIAKVLGIKVTEDSKKIRKEDEVYIDSRDLEEVVRLISDFEKNYSIEIGKLENEEIPKQYTIVELMPALREVRRKIANLREQNPSKPMMYITSCVCSYLDIAYSKFSHHEEEFHDFFR